MYLCHKAIGDQSHYLPKCFIHERLVYIIRERLVCIRLDFVQSATWFKFDHLINIIDITITTNLCEFRKKN